MGVEKTIRTGEQASKKLQEKRGDEIRDGGGGAESTLRGIDKGT